MRKIKIPPFHLLHWVKAVITNLMIESSYPLKLILIHPHIYMQPPKTESHRKVRMIHKWVLNSISKTRSPTPPPRFTNSEPGKQSNKINGSVQPREWLLTICFRRKALPPFPHSGTVGGESILNCLFWLAFGLALMGVDFKLVGKHKVNHKAMENGI